jgi:prephenate dehydratase
MKLNIAIQGVKGSFHHEVAKNHFVENYTLQECMSFNELVNNILENKSDIGIMALENSIAGSIIPNYALIDQNNLNIIGEYFLDINMNLMALEGQSINDITEIHSHPIALLQCAVFFSDYPQIKLIESVDTAETAQRIKNKLLKGIGAVGSLVAAEMYELNVLAKSIHTVKSNKTRFVFLKKNIDSKVLNPTKASIKFELEDAAGSLATILNVMKDCDLNLTKIQSMPIIDKPFQYSFFVDVVFDNYNYFEKAKSILELMTKEFKILGIYNKGK